MRRFEVLYTIPIVVVGCTNQGQSDSSATSSPKPPSNAAPSLPVTLVPAGLVHGATNHDRLGLHKFSYAPTNGPPAVWSADVEKAATYRCSQVSVKPKVVQLDAKGGAPPLVELRAPAELPADDWCWLLVEQSPTLRVGYDGKSSGVWHAHFFTGSALRPVRVKVSGKNPKLVSLTFSEPFDAAPLIGKAFVSPDNGAAIKCVLKGALCAAVGESFFTQALDVEMSSPVGAVGITVTLPGNLAGAGRDVAAGAAASKTALNAGNLAVHVASGDWKPCEDTASCWTHEMPPPTP